MFLCKSYLRWSSLHLFLILGMHLYLNFVSVFLTLHLSVILSLIASQFVLKSRAVEAISTNCHPLKCMCLTLPDRNHTPGIVEIRSTVRYYGKIEKIDINSADNTSIFKLCDALHWVHFLVMKAFYNIFHSTFCWAWINNVWIWFISHLFSVIGRKLYLY